MSRPRLACLVVTRDDADRLPAWLDAVRPLADAILALDEGSSDGSVALLEREPLVRTLLHAEPSGAGTRAPAVNRLLDAAAQPGAGVAAVARRGRARGTERCRGAAGLPGA